MEDILNWVLDPETHDAPILKIVLIFGPVVVFALSHIVASAYRAIWGSGFSRKLSIGALVLFVVPLIIYLVLEDRADNFTLPLTLSMLAAVVLQVASAFARGHTSRIPDIAYACALLLALIAPILI